MDNFLDFLKKYWWLALFFVLFPYFIAFIFYFPSIPPDLGLSYKEWLNFWGVFIGSAIGGLTALYSIFRTINQNEKIHQEDRDNDAITRTKEVLPILELKGLESLNFIGEQLVTNTVIVDLTDTGYEINNRLLQINKIRTESNLILYRIQEETYPEINQENITIYQYYIKNIGMGPAVELVININYPTNSYKTNFVYFTLGTEQGLPLIIKIPRSLNEISFVLKIIFDNIYEKAYYQDFTFKRIPSTNPKSKKDLSVKCTFPKEPKPTEYKKYQEWG
jgi:hypothetical protein